MARNLIAPRFFEASAAKAFASSLSPPEHALEMGVWLGTRFAEAERLRDEVAEVPRVVLDPRLIREAEGNVNLRAQHHTVPTELGYIRELLRQDADGLWFVDSLKAFAAEVDEPSACLDFLSEHRRFVERQLGATTSLDRASRVWTWLWSYHNQVVDACVAQGRVDERERDRLRIPAQGPLLYLFPPSARAPA